MDTNQIRISISGTHGTGKSTLINRIRQIPFFDEFTIIPGVTRVAKNEMKLSINEDGDSNTQLYVLSVDIQNFIKSRNQKSISDRCILDTLVYTQDLYNKGKLESDVLESIAILAGKLLLEYDIIFLLEPEFELKSDEDRVSSIKYQEEIQNIFTEITDFLKIEDNLNVVKLTGSVDERINQIENTIIQWQTKKN